MVVGIAEIAIDAKMSRMVDAVPFLLHDAIEFVESVLVVVDTFPAVDASHSMGSLTFHGKMASVAPNEAQTT